MEGLVGVTYWLGWVFLVLAVIARILAYTSLVDRMVALGVLPRNFFELAFLFFVACIAGSMVHRQKS